MTGARLGAIATMDELGVPRDFVTSGLTDEHHRAMREWSDGPRLFAHLRRRTRVPSDAVVNAALSGKRLPLVRCDESDAQRYSRYWKMADIPGMDDSGDK